MTFDNALYNKLYKRMVEKLATETTHLTAGAASDYADYRARTKYLAALGDVMTWMQEIESDLRQGK